MDDILLIYAHLLAPMLASFVCGALLQQRIHQREFNEWCKMFDRLFEIIERAQRNAIEEQEQKGGDT